jgi:hemerythrin-like domain-containing protein
MKKLSLGIAMRIATEHLSYRSLIEEIEADLESVRGTEIASTRNVLRLLRSFHDQVRAHFALEERGGLFEVYMENDFAFRRQAATLLSQHRDFLARLRRILDLLDTLTRPDGPEFEGCVQELRELFHALRAHEEAEDELLESLVEQDIRHAT